MKFLPRVLSSSTLGSYYLIGVFQYAGVMKNKNLGQD